MQQSEASGQSRDANESIQSAILIYNTDYLGSKSISYDYVLKETQVARWVFAGFPTQSSDFKQLLGLGERAKLGDRTSYQLVLWQLDRQGPQCRLDLQGSKESDEVIGLEFSQIDPMGFSVLRRKSLELYRVEVDHEELRSKTSLLLENRVMLQHSQKYSAMKWLRRDNLLVTVLEGGQVTVYNSSGEVRAQLSQKQDFQPTSLAASETGFFLAGTKSNILQYRVSLAHENEEHVSIEELQRLVLNTSGLNPSQQSEFREYYDILDLSLSPIKEEKLILALSNNSIYTLKIDPGSYEQVQLINDSFHLSGINSIDISVRKSLIATAGKDKTIRIWNFLTKKLEISYQFNEEPLCVSFHPSGFHVKKKKA